MEENKYLRLELANALSHGIGIILILAFSPLLFIKAAENFNPYILPAISVYVFGLLMVFTFSTLYHATLNPLSKRILRIFDHISIYFLIGGTYLPLMLLYADPLRAKVLLTIQWLVIFLGIIKKVFFTGRYEVLSTALYVGLGVMVLFSGNTFWTGLPSISFWLLIGGGLFYLFGVYFYQKKNWLYTHFVWHLFVLAAAILQFGAVYLAL